MSERCGNARFTGFLLKGVEMGKLLTQRCPMAGAVFALVDE
jgi:hypothetical protein